jgi:hypothetical protein
LRILDVEPIVPVEPEATLVLDRLAPVLSSASGAAAFDEAFAVGFDFNTHRVEAALGLASFFSVAIEAAGFAWAPSSRAALPVDRSNPAVPSLLDALPLNL